MVIPQHATLFHLDQLAFIQRAMQQRYPVDVIRRFWQKVTYAQPCTCHAWEERCTGWSDALSHGYGRFSVFGHPWDAHRFLYDALYGPLPADKWVLHIPPCLVRACIRHLYLGTPRQNVADTKMMGRFPTGEHSYRRLHPESCLRGDKHPAHLHPEMRQGERNGRATITVAIVQAIRADRQAGMKLRELEHKYAECGKSCILHIVAGHTWKHLLS